MADYNLVKAWAEDIARDPSNEPKARARCRKILDMIGDPPATLNERIAAASEAQEGEDAPPKPKAGKKAK